MASVVVNKKSYDFASLELEINMSGESFGIVADIDELEYNTTINREKFYGAGRIPKVRTEGRAEFDGSMTVARYWLDFLLEKVKEAGIGWAQAELTMGVSYVDQATGNVVTDTLTGVRFGEFGHSHSSGEDHLMTSVPLDIMNVYYSGVDAFGYLL